MLNKHLEQDNRWRVLPSYVVSSRHGAFETATGNYGYQISRDASICQASFFVSKSLLFIFCLYKYNGIASRVNSRIQRWSADYRLAIAQSVGLKNEEAGPSTG
jgi:hypothetical protein